MMPEQLSFDGRPVPYPMPKPKTLTERQRRLLRYMRAHQSLLDVGSMDTRHVRMFYADANGALRRLETLGLVERVAHGKWRAS